MGRDKALLPHPEGGTWLERTLRLLADLHSPITLLSRHPQHLVLAERLGKELQPSGEQPQAGHSPLTALAEPPPWEGPLLALHRLMEHHPNQRLLLCPVDMPALNLGVLQSLLAAADAVPGAIHLAHDGERLQPLLGLYPSDPAQRDGLATAIAQGERRLQSWLTHQSCHRVTLAARTIRNVNRPEDI